MYLPVPSQPDCASAWREAVRAVDRKPGHAAQNVIIDVVDPTAGATRQERRVAVVDDFLSRSGKSVEAIANTIFPSGLYRRHGAPAFFDVFRNEVLPKVRRNDRWSGYYFERMIQHQTPGGEVNQLWDIVRRLRERRALNKFELPLFDPARDVDNSRYGGQCLSFLSFKLLPDAPKTLVLTAMYHNHFYIEKLLGNLVGLGRLMAFVAHEGGLNVGALTVISTHAVIDTPKSVRRADIEAMVARFDQAGERSLAVADVACQPVGILRDQLDSVGAVGLVDAHCPRGADTVAVQEQHDLADDLLLGPAGDDPFGALRPDPADFAQSAGFLRNHLEHNVTKGANELFRVDGSDAPDHPGTQVFLDPLDRRRRRRLKERGSELDAVGTIVDPAAARLDKLASRDHRGVADDGKQLSLAAGLDPQHTEAALRIMKRHPVDQTGQNLCRTRR
jgi:hypothetical protein